MQSQICPLTAICVSTLALKFNILDGQFEWQSAYEYYFIQRVQKGRHLLQFRKIGIGLGNRQIAYFFHNQKIFIKDC